MHYVYLIESTQTPTHRHVGLTSDLKQRLADHNAGKDAHSSNFKPWRLVTYVAFSVSAESLYPGIYSRPLTRGHKIRLIGAQIEFLGGTARLSKKLRCPF